MGRAVVICDFDGTVTETDNIISIMKKFAPKEWERLKDLVLSQKLSIQEGVGSMFSLLPSHLREDIVGFLKQTVVIRKGFPEFTEYCRSNDIPLYIVSGGLDFFVEPLLKGYVRQAEIYCNKADFKGNAIKINWPHSCDQYCDKDCGCCKPSIIRKLVEHDDKVVVIGDSITDLEAAKIADIVFARGFLAEKCSSLGIPYHEFNTFTECLELLSELKEVEV
ncbi:2-hydroxy-3-keto-5-methylthiopentenyl-1-phosphate phosphatase [Falsibacillus albus]|uniref:2-hydroxy-3-keto-5-methylthiopentenyl-1-phosphate phosphatase n=1 Tax=Falsibacillus albus TaxID=2478915 RepID=A0A3L7K222_9BACI|nr:2-hydroxy-3-keto-5-methylthiopentenyl-1-phosphate phosphatase [Falsibacillus albus]RLQ97106.1 2-hydroxy-3-keto-5-methylthiopentenyl-1-phosphate phosphatase [Falsibacillus albus]